MAMLVPRVSLFRLNQYTAVYMLSLVFKAVLARLVSLQIAHAASHLPWRMGDVGRCRGPVPPHNRVLPAQFDKLLLC